MATKTYWFKADHTDATTGLVWRAGVTDRVTDTGLQSRLEAATGPAGEKVVVDLGAAFVEEGDFTSWPLSADVLTLLAQADKAGMRGTGLGLGTAATANTGSSGANVPLLNVANTWGARQVFDGAGGQSIFTGVNNAPPATSGTTQTGSTLRLGSSNTVIGLDFGFDNTGRSEAWLQSVITTDLSISYALNINPRGGPVYVSGHTVWHQGNTTVDGSGFVKQASPIVRVGAGEDADLGFVAAGDGAANAKATGAVITRQGEGLYVVTGTLGLARKGWQLEAPKDHNGNLICHVEVEEDAAGIAVAVSEPVFFEGRWIAGGPMDIPEGRWVDLRLHEDSSLAEVPAPPDAPPSVFTPQPYHVHVERDRRLSLGFDYDFGDGRGVHRIGTSEGDTRGWQEVSTASAAAIAIGQGEFALTIMTDTGPAEITALEWQAILLAAAAFRQPIWQASFALERSDPIPTDFADDQYWSP